MMESTILGFFVPCLSLINLHHFYYHPPVSSVTDVLCCWFIRLPLCSVALYLHRQLASSDIGYQLWAINLCTHGWVHIYRLSIVVWYPNLSLIYILFGVYIYRLSIFVWSLCFIGCLYFVWSPNLMGLYLLDPYLLAAHVYWCLCFVSRLKFVIVSMFYQMMRVIFVIVIMITLDVAILVFSVLSQLVRCPHHQQSNDSTRYYVFVIFGCIYCFCFSRCLL